jgi:hypothetical protein
MAPTTVEVSGSLWKEEVDIILAEYPDAGRPDAVATIFDCWKWTVYGLWAAIERLLAIGADPARGLDVNSERGAPESNRSTAAEPATPQLHTSACLAGCVFRVSSSSDGSTQGRN